MTKEQAIALLGAPTAAAAARRLDITPQGFSKWPDPLLVEQADRVRGCAMRLGLEVPIKLRKA